jgi:hypothetical protein
MGSNPANLAFRFMLELAALGVFGFWGWQQADNILLKIVLAVGLPITAAVLWATFAVPNDPSRSGKAPVPVPGWLRLILELVFFVFAAWALFDLGFARAGLILAILVLIHYALSYDRLLWLLKNVDE